MAAKRDKKIELKKGDSFETIWKTDMSGFIEHKDTTGKGGKGLSYLSWPYAWAAFKTIFPDATYEVVKFEGLPYIADISLGIMCYTKVTAGGITHEMWLPVMDGSNKAMKLEPYTYTVKDYNGQFKEKVVAAASMFDVNKTVMRCLVKNLAMFGLGLSIYAGEDIPQPLTDDEEDALKHQMQVSNLPKVTVEDIRAGRAKKAIAYLAENYLPNDGMIAPEAIELVKAKYNWEQGAFNLLIESAFNQATS